MIVVRGGYGRGNLGDDLLMRSVSNILQTMPTPKQCVFQCQPSKYLSKWMPDTTIISQKDLIDNQDLVIYGGGTQFYSFQADDIKAIWRNRLQQLVRHPLVSAKQGYHRLYANQPSKPSQCIAIGIGLGPFAADSAASSRTKRLLSVMDYVSVRDPISYALCNNWSIKNAHLRTDLCFTSHMVNWIRALCTTTRRRHSKVGIVVRDWAHTQRGAAYEKHIKEILQFLKERRQRVEFFLFKKGDQGWHNLLCDMGQTIHVWDPYDNSLDDYLKKMSECEILVSSRYHGVVLGAIIGRPCICIEIEPKLKLIQKAIGHGTALWSYPFDINSFRTAFAAVSDERSDAQKNLDRFVEQNILIANDMVSEVTRYLQGVV
jgi:polysaccharide pyruvyl transferase WcaK-like protein